ncbi:MAG TPA: hypothetical protein VGF38_06405 [Ktedonobacterales bacterium]|jgi:hypothetical protein
MPDLTAANPATLILSVFIASIPGVVVALLSQYLQQRREDQNNRRVYLSARGLLAAEVSSNRAALEAFWRAINALDTAAHTDLKEHLTAMAENGLLGYPLPHWGLARWQRLEAITFPAFTAEELTAIEQINRGLESITDLYTQLITLTPEEKAQIEEGGSVRRFWASYYATWRDLTFTRLTEAVNQALDAPQPIAK